MVRRKTAQERRLEAILRKMEPQMRDAFLAAIQAQAQAIDITELVAALERGDIERAVNMFRANQQLLFPLTEAVRASVISGSASIAAALPITIRAQFGLGGNERAAATIERVTGKLAEILEAEQLDVARQVFTKGVMEGVPPRKQALDMVGRITKGTKVRKGGFIGLDSQRAAQAERVREMLSDPARVHEYFNGKNPRYKTTDRRFDATIRKAIADGKAVPAETLQKITQSHKSRLLKNRGETIARTETLNALRAGQHDGFGTLADTGTQITKKWQSTGDGRTRDAHVDLGGKEPIDFKELFHSQTGAQLAFPGDTANGAGPDDLIQCRCAVIYRIKPKVQA